jgi:hypothetical protein
VVAPEGARRDRQAGEELVQVPPQAALQARAFADEIVAVVDQQPQLGFCPMKCVWSW